jgi:hypothetical protein
MKREKKVEFGIEIVKPWSQAMYDHNDEVAEVVRFEVKELLDAAVNNFLADFDLTEDALTLAWEDDATPELKNIQTAVTCYGFGSGYTVERVIGQVEQELEDAPLYRLKDIAEELGLALEKGFVGFS